jgi:hypothetical protein
MLNKEVCKRCKTREGDWSRDDESFWQRGLVMCPLGMTGRPKVPKISGETPEWCKYSLEHIVVKEVKE